MKKEEKKVGGAAGRVEDGENGMGGLRTGEWRTQRKPQSSICGLCMQTNQPEKDSRHSRTFSSDYQIISEVCYCIRGEKNTRIMFFKRALIL